MRWQPTRDLRLNLSSEYIDQTYKHYVTSDAINLSGQPVGTPTWAAAAGVEYFVRGVAGGDINLTLQHAYSGATRCNADSLQGNCLVTPAFRVGEAQQRTDLRIGYEAGNHHWGLALYANNLFDKRYVTGVGNTSTSTIGTPYASVNAPRKLGLELRLSM
jgi:iron complex outermembrane receptor protein